MSNNHPCKYTDKIECCDQQCANCGWNPDVAKKRIARWKKECDIVEIINRISFK